MKFLLSVLFWGEVLTLGTPYKELNFISESSINGAILIDVLSATPSQYSEHNEVSAKSWILSHLSALSIYSAHVTMVNECCIKY